MKKFWDERGSTLQNENTTTIILMEFTMKVTELPAFVREGLISRHKTKARKLLGSNGRLLEGIEKTVQAMEGARSDWDEKLTAYYIVELHTLVEELLNGSGEIDELRY
jgi:hypothetical protein